MYWPVGGMAGEVHKPKMTFRNHAYLVRRKPVPGAFLDSSADHLVAAAAVAVAGGRTFVCFVCDGDEEAVAGAGRAGREFRTEEPGSDCSRAFAFGAAFGCD